jgi:diguanylate cyclase (GGDEF)-like protein/PAS domain S-box-containing protein
MRNSAPAVRLRLALTDTPRLVSASSEVRDLLGYSAEELTAESIKFPDYLHADDRDLAAPMFAPKPASCKGQLSLRMRHADGRIRCLRADYTKRRKSAHGPVVLDLKLRDARSCTDPALLTGLTCLRPLMERTSDYIYLKDRNHVFIAATRSMSDFARKSQGEFDFTGKTVYDIYPEAQADLGYELDRKVLAEGRPAHEIQQVLTADGSYRWIDDRKYPLFNQAGEVIGIFGICPNITEPLDAERRLRESRDLLQLFVEHAPAPLAMFDREMRYLAVSRRWRQAFGLGEQEIVGRSHYEVFPEIPERWRELHRRALAGETLRSEEDSFVRSDGSMRWLRRELRPWLTAEGDIGGMLLFAEEITEQRRDREQLKLAASVFTQAREGIVITDPRGTILDVNEMFTRISGYSRGEAIGRNPRMLQSGRQSAEFYRDMWRALLENGQWSGEIWNKAKDGRIYPEILTISAVYDRGGQVQHYVGLFSDVTEAREQEQRLARVASFDALTNLPNRTLFADRLQQAIAQAHRRQQTLTVACMDLDGFRHVNERCGRDTGDRLLTELAQRMLQVLREGDTLARIGGDRFAAILLDAGDSASARPLLDRLLAAASEPDPCGDSAATVSASLGVAFYNQADMVDAGHLLRRAEQAMHQAKLGGKNRCEVFDPSQDAVIRTHQDEVEQIRRAFERQEFVMYYQPCVNMSTGAVIAAEALVRWQHPEQGLLAPAAFLPIIENHELMKRMGEWGLDTALTQLELWRDAGLEIAISVNIAAHHLQQPDFVDRLWALLTEHPRVRRSMLELEVLESSALRDLAQVSTVLSACRDLGVSVALDDFGTGYSSLTWLRRLPVNILKIDQSFVREMLDNPDDLTILEGILGLAAAFDRMAIAEGVETVEHGRLLLQLGCVYGQGYGIARPMPAEQLPAWRSAWKPDLSWTIAGSAGPERRGFLQAAVAHRAWAVALEAFLKGERHVPPHLDPHRCRFGLWLDRERQKQRAASPAFEEMDRLHRQIHAWASRLSAPEWQATGVDAQIGQLRRLGESFARQFDVLLGDTA